MNQYNPYTSCLIYIEVWSLGLLLRCHLAILFYFERAKQWYQDLIVMTVLEN